MSEDVKGLLKPWERKVLELMEKARSEAKKTS